MYAMLFSRPWVLPAGLLLISAGPLGLALLSQYGFGLHPCELCIWQRYPYGLLIGLAVLAFIFQRYLKLIVVLSILIWLVEAGLAFYHVGVEQHWWESAGGCTAPRATGQSIDDLRAQIMGSPIVACDEPAFVLFGLSMAGWNVLLSLGCALGLCLLLMKWRPQNGTSGG